MTDLTPNAPHPESLEARPRRTFSTKVLTVIGAGGLALGLLVGGGAGVAIAGAATSQTSTTDPSTFDGTGTPPDFPAGPPDSGTGTLPDGSTPSAPDSGTSTDDSSSQSTTSS